MSIATPCDNGIPVASQVAEMPAAAVPTAAVEHDENNEAEVTVMDESAPSSSSATNEKGKEKELINIDPIQFVTRQEYEESKAMYTSLQV
jgi:hypothetical protein